MAIEAVVLAVVVLTQVGVGGTGAVQSPGEAETGGAGEGVVDPSPLPGNSTGG